MSRFCLPVIVVSLIFFAGVASAQSPLTKPNESGEKIRSKSGDSSEADRAAKQRRAEARSLLLSLASDARSFRDQVLRARSLARIADSLWPVDPDQGRALFRQAW